MWPFTRKKAAEPPPPPEPVAPVAPPESELARLQREVFERIVSGGAGPAGIEDWRLQIYAGMYEARTHDALIEDLPHTAKLLGGEFPAVVKRYVADLPSTHHSLAHLGHGFAKWLREHPVTVAAAAPVVPDAPAAPVEPAPPTTAEAPASEAEPAHHHHPAASSEHASRPDLSDLAALEWARSEAFIADDFTPVEPETVQQMGPERFTQAWMQFVPSLRLLKLEHDVLPLWKACEESGELPAPSPVHAYAVVWRKGFEVFHVAIAEDEYQAMVAAQARETVAQVCERFAARGDDAAHAAFQAIGSWLTEGMVAALREPPLREDYGL